MNVLLSPELERRIVEMVASGAYASVNALLAEALQALEDRDRACHIDMDAVRAAIERSIAEIDAGQGLEGGQFFRGLVQRGKGHPVLMQ